MIYRRYHRRMMDILIEDDKDVNDGGAKW